MNKLFTLVRGKLIDVKIYIARTMSWISITNSLMLVFLVIERLSSLGIIKGDLGDSLIFVVVGWFLLLVLLGWIEVKKMQVPHAESLKMLEFNLPMKHVVTKVDEIDQRIKNIEKKLNENK